MKKLMWIAALVVSGSAFAADEADSDAPPAGATAKEMWAAKCKSCHGEDGKAKTKQGEKYKIDDLTTAAWQEKHSDEKIRTAIAEGVKNTKMKAYKEKLTAEQIDALVKHIRTFKP